MQEIANDFLWVFVGGTPPYDFLKKTGVQFGMRDMTAEAGTNAKQAARSAAWTRQVIANGKNLELR